MSTHLIIFFALMSSVLSTTVYNNGVDNIYHHHRDSHGDDYHGGGGGSPGGAVSYSHFVQEYGRPALVHQSREPKQNYQHHQPAPGAAVSQFHHHSSQLLTGPVQPIAYKVQPLPLALDRSYPVALTKYPVQVIKPLVQVPYYVEKPVPVQEDRKDFVQTKVPLVYHAIYECCRDKLDHQPDYVLTKVPLVYQATFPEHSPKGNSFSDYNAASSRHPNF